MKILFLTPQRPFPTHQGTTIRNFNLIRELARRHQIWLLTFLEPTQHPDNGPLDDLCEQVETIPLPQRSTLTRLQQMAFTTRPDMSWRLWSPQFARHLETQLRQTSVDIVHLEGIEMAPYLSLVRQFAPQAKIIYDDHNAEWLLQQRNFLNDLRNPRRWVAAAYSYIQTQRLKRYERWICRAADVVVTCSHPDRTALQRLDSSLRVVVIPNGVDLTRYSNFIGQTIPFDIVFTGKMDYRPNIDAVLWFGDEVLPKIQQVHPSVTLGIVGQKPHARLDVLRQNRAITITGEVDEILPYIGGAGVYIAPFRVGGGTRLKLLEAMAMRKAIVATAVGAEGYPITPGQEMVIADDAFTMAAEISRLLTDSEVRAKLGQKAFQFVEAGYTWESIVPQFETLY